MRKRKQFVDISGKRFGRLVAIRHEGYSENNASLWVCKCDCGNEKITLAKSLNRGGTKSCGCLHADANRAHKRQWVHGLSQTGVANSWRNMMKRCYDTENEKYPLYGARGIVICERLRISPKGLLGILGQRDNTLSIDRIDNDGNYSCGDCDQCRKANWPMNIRWATPAQQSRNTRRTRLITIAGETRCITDWAHLAGVSVTAMWVRVKRRWPEHLLLTPPSRQLSQARSHHP